MNNNHTYYCLYVYDILLWKTIQMSEIIDNQYQTCIGHKQGGSGADSNNNL